MYSRPYEHVPSARMWLSVHSTSGESSLSMTLLQGAPAQRAGHLECACWAFGATEAEMALGLGGLRLVVGGDRSAAAELQRAYVS